MHTLMKTDKNVHQSAGFGAKLYDAQTPECLKDYYRRKPAN